MKRNFKTFGIILFMFILFLGCNERVCEEICLFAVYQNGILSETKHVTKRNVFACSNVYCKDFSNEDKFYKSIGKSCVCRKKVENDR